MTSPPNAQHLIGQAGLAEAVEQQAPQRALEDGHVLEGAGAVAGVGRAEGLQLAVDGVGGRHGRHHAVQHVHLRRLQS